MTRKKSKIGIVGGGITGLATAYYLLKRDYEVTVFEKGETWGGLASAFKWDSVTLERYYHHLFTNDTDILKLAQDLGISDKLLRIKPTNAIWYNDQLYPFSGPLDVLKFSPLTLPSRVRWGAVTAGLKAIPDGTFLREQTASSWLKKWYGKNAYQVVWEPLLKSKFGSYYEKISMSWMWARIYKRTSALVYPEGGFQTIIDALVAAVKNSGGLLKSDVSVDKISHDKGEKIQISHDGKDETFDKVVFTGSYPLFMKLAPTIPDDYKEKLSSVNYLWAQVMVLALKKSLIPYYWLNINDTSFPFLALVEHTNFVPKEKYGDHHLVYLGNYLEDGDKRLKMSEQELFDYFLPYLKKINSKFDPSWVTKKFLFTGPYAQPVVTTDYKEKIPDFKTPIPNLYLASQAQIYPWDRGTNYTVKLAKDLVGKHF